MTPSIALTCLIIRFLRRPLLNDLGRLAAWAVHNMQEKEVIPPFYIAYHYYSGLPIFELCPFRSFLLLELASREYSEWVRTAQDEKLN
jgi:hypothetical protein